MGAERLYLCPMARLRRYLPFPALAAAALALAACGGGGGNAPTTTAAKAKAIPTANAKRAVAAAAAKTKATSLRVDINVTLTKPGAPNALVYGAEGYFTPTGGHLQIDRRNIGGMLQNEIVSRQAGHLVLYTSPTTMTLPKGKTWLQVDMTRFALDRYGAATNFLAGADQDPVEALTLVTSPQAKVTDLGLGWLPDATLDHHYRGTVSIIAVAQAAGVKGAQLKALRTDMGNQVQTIDVWVRKSGQVGRIVINSPVKAADGTLLHQRSTTDFSQYGTKVTVALPPASKVQDYFTLTTK